MRIGLEAEMSPEMIQMFSKFRSLVCVSALACWLEATGSLILFIIEIACTLSTDASFIQFLFALRSYIVPLIGLIPVTIEAVALILFRTEFSNISFALDCRAGNLGSGRLLSIAESSNEDIRLSGSRGLHSHGLLLFPSFVAVHGDGAP